MAKKCILFVRVSTEKQSFDEQEQELLKMALNDGYREENIIPIAYKESGIKLSEDERLGITEMKELIKNDSEIDCCYVWEVSRLARKKSVLFSVTEFLLKRKIQLVIKNPATRLLDIHGKIDEGAETIFTLYGQMAESEMRNKRERFRRGKRENAKKGRYNGGTIPFGYCLNDDNTFRINDEQKKIITDIFDWYETGKYSMTQIVKKLKDNYIEREKRFTLSFVAHILQNELLTGKEHEEKSFEGDEKRGNWHLFPRSYPTIITKEQFYRCREIATQNRTNADKCKNIYYANKIFICPTCGRKMVGVGAKSVYICYNANDKNLTLKGNTEESRCKDHRNYSINIVDSILWQCGSFWEVRKLVRDSKEKKAKIDKHIKELKEQIKVAEEEIERIKIKKDKNLDLYYDGRISKDKFNEKDSIFEKESDHIKAKIRNKKKEIEQQNNLLKSLEIDKEYGKILKNESINYFINTPQWKDFMTRIEAITDDAKRSEIIHQNVKSLEVQEQTVPIMFKVGIRDTKMRLFIATSFDNDKLFFYVISISNQTFIEVKSSSNIFNRSMKNRIYYMPKESDVKVTQRYTNVNREKNRKIQREIKKAEEAKRKKGKYTIKQLMELSGYGYHKLRYAMTHNKLHAEKDGKQFLVTKEDWDNYYSSVKN